MQPTVYGELSILGYNGAVLPSVERSNRRTKSKFLLCKRQTPNGIKKSRHYIVDTPQATKAVQDKELHSISYAFSHSQAVIVEYAPDPETDMFQIGRSFEAPIDFVVNDTIQSNPNLGSPNQRNNHYNHRSNKLLNNNNLSAALIHHNYPSENNNLSRISDIPPFLGHHQILSGHVRYEQDVHMQQMQLIKPPELYSYHHPNSELLHSNYYSPPNHPSRHNMPVLLDNFNQNQQDYLNFQCPYLSRQNQQPHQSSVEQSAPRNSKSHNSPPSTISRFACRIIVDRDPPYTARIYAAGFDTAKNIFLGEKATKWEQGDSIDALTTNGVLLMHPRKNFPSCDDEKKKDNIDIKSYKGNWREVSVDGNIHAMRESRSASKKGARIDDESNVLQDGTLIDLCGATLLWRTQDGFKSSPSKESLENKVDLINASRPQCPVGLNTLVIPRKPVLSDLQRNEFLNDTEYANRQPYVYLKCGHVQGSHDWGTTKSNQRKCPICFSVGIVSKLAVGIEPSFYVDSGELTHAFNPCGHMASEKTVKYWSSVKIPHGTNFYHSVCPFCAVPLTQGQASTKLIFQDYVD